MQQMAIQNNEIRMSPHFVSANLAKGGGHVTMGVDATVIYDLMSCKYTCALYIIDQEAFFNIKKKQPVTNSERLLAGLQLILKFDPEAELIARVDHVLLDIDADSLENFTQSDYDYMTSIGWYLCGTTDAWKFNTND